MKNYILVTPMKNEENNVSTLIECVEKQINKPHLWIIVNDGSTDNTLKILKKFSKNMSWIKILNLKQSKRNLGIHYSEVCMAGFEHAIKLSTRNKVQYDYIGLLDADIILPKNYFSKLLLEFSKNVRLGVASGHLSVIDSKGFKKTPRSSNDVVCGAARLWDKKCFVETGGYLPVMSPDTVSSIKAKLSGWDIFRFKSIGMLQTRETASVGGKLKGYYDLGERHYYLGFNFLHIFLKSIKLSLTSFSLVGLYYFLGYCSDLLKKNEQICDDEIKNYFKNKIL